MANISFIAILFGAAGVVGGIEKSNMVGTIAAAAIHIVGIVGMAIAKRKEGDGTDEDEEDDGAYPGGRGPVDNPSGTRTGGHAADR